MNFLANGTWVNMIKADIWPVHKLWGLLYLAMFLTFQLACEQAQTTLLNTKKHMTHPSPIWRKPAKYQSHELVHHKSSTSHPSLSWPANCQLMHKLAQQRTARLDLSGKTSLPTHRIRSQIHDYWFKPLTFGG